MIVNPTKCVVKEKENMKKKTPVMTAVIGRSGYMSCLLKFGSEIPHQTSFEKNHF